MTVAKLAISLPEDLAEAIRTRAMRDGTSVSRWLHDAAQDRMRAEALYDAVREFEAEHGAFTEEESVQATRHLNTFTTVGRCSR